MGTVLITGGSGKLGRFVVDRFRRSGWDTISADRVPHPDKSVKQVLVNLRNSGEVLDLITGVNDRFKKLDAAVQYLTPGFEAFIIANSDSLMRRTNQDLLDEVFPQVPKRREFSDHESLLDIGKAKRHLGYQPKYTWRSNSGAK